MLVESNQITTNVFKIVIFQVQVNWGYSAAAAHEVGLWSEGSHFVLAVAKII